MNDRNLRIRLGIFVVVTLVLLGGEVLMLLKRRRAVARIAPEPKVETRKAKFEAAMVSDKL